MEFNEDDIDVFSIGYLRSFHIMIMNIPDDALQLEAFRAVTNYMMTGKLPEEMNWQVKIIMEGGKPVIDKSRNKSKSGQTETSEKQKNIKPKSNQNQTEIKSKSNEEQKKNIEEEKEEDIEKDIKTSSSPRSATDARFDIFWQTYPNKVGKENARKAWSKIKPDAELFDKIIKKVEELKVCDDWTKDGGQYVPHPATWLNRGGWDDEIPKSRSPGRKNSFQNFTGRTRTKEDYEDIERGLLGVRRRA